MSMAYSVDIILKLGSTYFFECGLSSRLWKTIMQLCLQSGMPMEWDICRCG
jgi:hypothetical protein